jgi:HAD superfamily hydrolase (TIGR01509 family)
MRDMKTPGIRSERKFGVKSRFAAVMFDMDGVLADTERLKGLAHVATAAALGFAVHLDLYAEVMGQSSEKVALYILDSIGAKSVDPLHYENIFRGKYNTLIRKRLKPMPGAVELLEMLAGSFRTAVVSSAERPVMDLILGRLKIVQLFDAIVSSEDVSKEKPNPEPYLLAARRLGTRNFRSVVFEDTEAGVRSAIEAGSRVIAVRHEFNLRHNFTDADLEVESLFQSERIEHFLEHPTRPKN